MWPAHPKAMTLAVYQCICRNTGWPVDDLRPLRAIRYLERQGQPFGSAYGLWTAVAAARRLRWQLREEAKLNAVAKLNAPKKARAARSSG